MLDITMAVVSLILGALGGLYLAVRYEDAWKARRNRRLRLKMAQSISRDRRHDGEALSIAGNLTGFHLVEGDGAAVIEPANVVVNLRSSARTPPQPIADLRQKIRRRLNASARSSEGTVAGWNSSTLVALDGYRISRSPDREDLVLHLDTHATDYATFAATVLSLDDEIQIADLHGVPAPTTLRRQFFPTQRAVDEAIKHPNPDLSNGLGIALLVFTDDDKVILSRRGPSSRARPGQRDVTVVEGLHAHHDLRSPGRLDVTWAAVRGCVEELGVPAATGPGDVKAVRPEDVRILGFGVDMQFYQWNFVGSVHLRTTAAEVLEAHAMNARDRWEGRLEVFPADPGVVFDRFRQDGTWDTALVTAYLAFCRTLGVAATRRAVESSLGRPSPRSPWRRRPS